ncbi:energy-coupled thiamine transporter ThiT [Candidatus Bathyarchaeota archaeon]|nr:energy-coupled thiamine transporter ThiT [Candidatus Bathyarchaeota archaeon]
MIPIFLLALRRGIKIGVLSSLAFGLIVLIEEPFIYHPVQGALLRYI